MKIERLLKLVIHGIYWIVFISFTTALSILEKSGNPTDFAKLPDDFIVNLAWAIVAFYASYAFLIQFFEKRRLLSYLGLSVALSIGVTMFFIPIYKFVYRQYSPSGYEEMIPPMIGTFVIIQTGILVRGFENWFNNIRLKPEIENKQLRMELESLKSQINPHFLFNTLNNIDALITKSPADASESLITLSDMLRYMIYDAKNDLVLLDDEVDYLRKFVHLQQLRHRKKDYVRTHLPVSTNDARIAPMLFLPFLENAFKHSVDKGFIPVIDIEIKLENRILHFKCENQYNAEGMDSDGRVGGVGLENVRRRLQLLYPEKHSLQINKKQDTFTVVLTVHL
jgi:two-component system, LytTR family, sensor kinase